MRTQDQWEEVSIDEAVLKADLARFTDALDWFFPRQKRISDEHISSGDESSGGQQGASLSSFILASGVDSVFVCLFVCL